MPLIMLDGVDGAGKTTYAERLCEAFDGPSKIIHKSQFEGDDSIAEYTYDLTNYDPAGQELVVLDRWHVSEMIYGSLLRGKSKVSATDVYFIQAFLKSLGCLPIIMTAPLPKLLARLEDRGEDYLPLGMVADIDRAYWAWAKAHNWHIVGPHNRLAPEYVLAMAKIDARVAVNKKWAGEA